VCLKSINFVIHIFPLFFFLKRRPVFDVTLFILPPFNQLKFCSYSNLECFLSSTNFGDYSVNHGLCCSNSYLHQFFLVKVSVSSQMLHTGRGQGTCSSWQHSQTIFTCVNVTGPPLWSNGQSSWLQIQRFRVRFPALSDYLRSSGSGTGSTQPREGNWQAT
jgi:hypothetical protein